MSRFTSHFPPYPAAGSKAYVCPSLHLFPLPHACHHSAGSGPCTIHCRFLSNSPAASSCLLRKVLSFQSRTRPHWSTDPLLLLSHQAPPCLLTKPQAGPLPCSLSEPPSCLCQCPPHPEGWVTLHVAYMTASSRQRPPWLSGCPLTDGMGRAEEMKGEWLGE